MKPAQIKINSISVIFHLNKFGYINFVMNVPEMTQAVLESQQIEEVAKVVKGSPKRERSEGSKHSSPKTKKCFCKEVSNESADEKREKKPKSE